jgi:hypothetical protein
VKKVTAKSTHQNLAHMFLSVKNQIKKVQASMILQFEAPMPIQRLRHSASPSHPRADISKRISLESNHPIVVRFRSTQRVHVHRHFWG